jgi:hypothetical protein
MKTLNKTALLATLAAVFLFNGCKKDIITSPTVNQAATKQAPGTKMVLVPRLGWVPDNIVHAIEPGYSLLKKNGHIFKIETATKKVITDFGVINRQKIPAAKPGSQQALNSTNMVSPDNGSGNSVPTTGNPNWVIYDRWNNPNSGNPITSFTATYKVPTAPPQYNGQTIYIYNGLSDTAETDILQPVLQYGASRSGGGAYWSINNWYVVGTSFVAYAANQITVTAGVTTLTGRIRYTGRQLGSGSYNYVSAFVGQPDSLTVIDGDTAGFKTNPATLYPPIPVQNTANLVIEAYSGAAGSPPPSNVLYYPAADSVNMTAIGLKTSNYATPITWTTYKNAAGIYDFGQKATTVSGVNPGGNVQLFFHSIPIISYATPKVYTVGTAIPNLSPTNTGTHPTTYSVSPTLPGGLMISASTGVISGTPTTVTSATNYTITATNTQGSGTFVVNITIILPGISFGITNNSSESISLTFMRTDQSQQNIGTVAVHNSGTNPPLSVPSGVYNILYSPAGPPVPCTVTLSNGVSSPFTVGYTFIGVTISPTGVTSLTAH